MTSTVEKFLRRSLTFAGIGAASVALAGCSLLGGAGNTGAEPDADGEEAGVFTIQVGDCLNGHVEGEVSTVERIDCAEPHDSEAYASVLLDDGEYPGDDAVVEQADEACFDEFETFVGLSYDDSVLTFSYYYPTPESWDSGDREVVCLILDVNDDGNTVKSEGTLKNANR
jgi:hypothetical protein